jgi:hypothetical protein
MNVIVYSGISSREAISKLPMRKARVFEKLYDSGLTKQMTYQLKIPLLAFHANVLGQDHENWDL